jgi:predicted N-acyltransferase
MRLGGVYAALAATTIPSTASAAEQPALKGGMAIQATDVKVAKTASDETRRIIAADAGVAAAAANVCGSGYTISTGAARYGTYGTTYTWTNGTTRGDRYYDKPICAVPFNDIGSAHTWASG